MALLNKLKSLLGLDDGQSNSDRQGTDTAGVTVERDPESDADERVPSETPAPGSDTAEPEPASDTGPAAEPDSESDSDPSIDPEIDGPSADEPDDSVAASEDEPTGPESEPMEMIDAEPDADATDESESEPEIGDQPSMGADSDVATGDEADEPETGSGGEPVEAQSLQEIKGIGPSYATRLSDAGIDSSADLSEADADELSESTGLSSKRIQGWIDRARSR